MWQNDTDGSRRRSWKSNWWEIINSFCRSITSLSPTGSPFWERRECGAKKFVERAESQSLTIWCTQHNWTNDNWRANSANSERQLENLAGNFVLFLSPLFLSLTPYAGGQQLILGCIHISFYFPPIFFWLLLLLLPFFLPPLLIPIFLFHVRRSRLRREKKKPPQGSDFVAPYTQIRPVPAVTIAASCLLRVCYSRTNERTTSGRARKKEKEKHVGIRSALE